MIHQILWSFQRGKVKATCSCGWQSKPSKLGNFGVKVATIAHRHNVKVQHGTRGKYVL